MARTIQDTDLGSKAARDRLPASRKPHWRLIERGLHVGYRRGPRGGVWFARRFADGAYVEKSLGAADDNTDADGFAVLSFSQAQNAARLWWQDEQRKAAGLLPQNKGGRYTVTNALDDYFDARERKGSKGARKDKYGADKRIIPDLGTIELAKLTTRKIRDWHTSLATAPKLIRTKKTADKQATRAIDADDINAVRSRRATANRLLTILKAALNHAFHENHVASDEAWRKVKPFKGVDTAIVRYLTEAECRRLVNACAHDFRDMVRAALLTGCRYGELTRMRVSAFQREAGTVSVQESKSGKPRHVVLTSEAQRFFRSATLGKQASALIFTRADGEAWGASHQQRPLSEASEKAGITPAATFHILRHTHASTLAMKGVPMGVIAAQLGHSDTRMTEKHYAHLSPSYIADTIRAHFPDMGLVEKIPSNVTSFEI